LRKQSDGSPEQSQPDPFVLFLDETLHNCQPIHSALEQAKVEYVRHGSRFIPGAHDVEWLPIVGEMRWALLTSDKNIRYNQLERKKIVQYGIREFVFATGNLSGLMMAEILTKAVPKMKRLFNSYPPPFIAYLSQSGKVEVRYDKGGSIHDRKINAKNRKGS
jgi:PIN like domain